MAKTQEQLYIIQNAYHEDFLDFIEAGEWKDSSQKVRRAVYARVDADIEQVIQNYAKLPLVSPLRNECRKRYNYSIDLINERIRTPKFQKMIDRKFAEVIKSASVEEFNDLLHSMNFNNLTPLAEKAKAQKLDMIIIQAIQSMDSLTNLRQLCQAEGGPLPYSIDLVRKRFKASARVESAFYKKKRESERLVLKDSKLHPAKGLPGKSKAPVGSRLIKSTAG
jgi:hypothetical protein